MNRTSIPNWLRHPLVRDVIAAWGLAAFLLTALLPHGYMPAGTGGMALKLCTSVGLSSTISHGAPHRDGGASDDSSCQFAAMPVGATPTSAYIDVVVMVRRGLGRLPPSSSPATTAGLERAQSARAPPTFA